MTAELGAVAAAAPVPLLTAQVRVVKNEGGILKQLTRALSRSSNYSNLQERVGPNHYLSHLE